jgi:cyclopropane fatty-acyl-phospholipid synthase-like methyltransferase
MSNQTVKDGYNKVAEAYLANYRDLFKNNKHLDLLIKYLNPKARILDIGCGAGIPIDKYLIEKGFDVTGIDVSEKQIELAKENLPDGKFKVLDMLELHAGDFHVDAIVSFYAIFHTPRTRHLEILKKMHSFLSDKGYLLVTMGSSEWEGTESNFCGTKMEWSHYDAGTNKQLIQDAGFKILFDEIDTSGGEKHLVVLAQKIS